MAKARKTPVIVRLSKAARKRCEEFASARIALDLSVYQKRGGVKREDLLSGAMAEEAVYSWLRKKGFKVEKPDFRILDSGFKSYDADLTDGNKKFHVKGQTYESVKRYGHSWLMQKYDPLIDYKNKGDLLNNYLVPCTVDFGGNMVHIQCIPSFTALHSHDCFSHCSVDWFNKTKVAIYGETLQLALTGKARWGLVMK